MASTSIHRSVRNEENVGQGVRNAKSADSQAGSKPARRALGELTNTSRAPLSNLSNVTSKKTSSHSKPVSHSSSATSSRRRRTAKVDLENPPDIERMTPFREKPEGPILDREVLDCTKAYRTDFASFLSTPLKMDVSLPADVDTLFATSSDDSHDDEVKMQELIQKSEEAVKEAASIGIELDAANIDLDQLLDDLNLF
ncbi:uncharacterized protein LOC135809601 [Sycon ciliatum]|uniref:uncharacterized protein LOC135809601 n=1 Tax=Sycon ciliatum TaxID=27933 RepID=UPI0031F6BA13